MLDILDIICIYFSFLFFRGKHEGVRLRYLPIFCLRTVRFKNVYVLYVYINQKGEVVKNEN